MTQERYIGLISGTSVDSIDAVMVDFSTKQPQIECAHAHPIPDSTKHEIITLCTPGDNEIQRMATVDNIVAELFADASLALIQKAGLTAEQVTAIGSHGQTIRHYPPVTPEHVAFTLQIGNPNIIAEKTGITTVADFRRRDMAAGGQGAPLVPAFHAAIFDHIDQHCVILNIGGIANITVLSSNQAEIFGFDTGPGNGLMDAWARDAFDINLDQGGEIASSGSIDQNLLESMLTDAYFKLEPPKSTGREHYNIAWLNKHLASHPSLSKEDIMMTLCELTAISVSQAIQHYSDDTQHVLVCGGGVHNKTLMSRLQHHLSNITVESTQAVGIDPNFVEACAFAWLAKQTLEHKPGNLPAVTGATKPVILGGIYY